jgi:hypothetical protein
VSGRDDYAHEGVTELESLPTFSHHFQRRDAAGRWSFEPSQMRGQVDVEIDTVISTVREYLQTHPA